MVMVRIVLGVILIVGFVLVTRVVFKDDQSVVSREIADSPVNFQVPLAKEDTPFDVPNDLERLPSFDNAIGGVVPHHLIASNFLAEFFEQLGKRQSVPQTIVLLAPNHFEVSEEHLQSANFIWKTTEGEVETDFIVLEKLKRGGAVIHEDTFQREHGIYNIIPYMAHFLPGTKVVPILFKHDTTALEIDQLVESIQEDVQGGRVFIISSVDFSHYLPRQESQRKDVETIEAIRKYDMSRIASFGSDHLDSPAAIMTLLQFGQKNDATNIQVLRHGNSADAIRSRSDSTTSHFTLLLSR